MLEDASPVDVVLRGGTVVTMDDRRRVIENGAVAITGDRITAVGTEDELAHVEGRRIIDTSGRAVMPGRVDCHTHLFQTLGKGLGDGMALWPWLCDFMWPYAAAITRDDAEIAVLLGAIQAARAGTTAVCDNHYAPTDFESTMLAAASIERVGLRGALARGITGRMNAVGRSMQLVPSLFQRSGDEELEITAACIAERPKGSTVEIWPAPLNVIYVDQDLFRDAVQLAHEHNVGWHTHCSEAPADPNTYKQFYGTRPVNWLYREGLLGRGATLAHGIWIDESEIAAIGETQTGVSYNPVSNQYLGCGALPLSELLAANAVVGLGTDGSAVAGIDMFEVTKQALLLQRGARQDPQQCPIETALELSTCNGAQFLGMDLGQVAVGKLADVIVVDLTAPHLAPVHRVAATLTYAAKGSDVRMTIVGGAVVYEDGNCTTIDENAVVAEARDRARHLLARTGMSDLAVPWNSKS